MRELILNKYKDNIKYPMIFDINNLIIDGDVLVDYCNEIIQNIKKEKNKILIVKCY